MRAPRPWRPWTKRCRPRLPMRRSWSVSKRRRRLAPGSTSPSRAWRRSRSPKPKRRTTTPKTPDLEPVSRPLSAGGSSEPLLRLGRLLGEVDHRLRIAEHLPLRHPPAAVASVRVEALPLALWVEDPEPRLRVDSRARDPLPVALVLRRVVVDQLLREPGFADAPVDVEVLDEEARGHHARAVVHPSGRSELAHAGVDERKAGHAVAPAVEALARRVPARLEARLVEAAALHVVPPVVPAELVEPLLATLARPRGECGGGAVVNRDLARRDQRRQSGRRVSAREVTVVGVPREPRLDELVDRVAAVAFLRRLPGAAESGERLHRARSSA